MKSTIFALLLAASASLSAFAQPRVVVGVGVGRPAYYGGYYAPGPLPPPPVVAYMPPSPGPGYYWSAGYWSYAGPRRIWVPGYWNPPVVRGYYGRPAPRYYSRPGYYGYRR